MKVPTQHSIYLTLKKDQNLSKNLMLKNPAKDQALKCRSNDLMTVLNWTFPASFTSLLSLRCNKIVIKIWMGENQGTSGVRSDHSTNRATATRPDPWSSLAEGDEQLDWPNSQTTLELCHACVALIFRV